MPLLGRGIGGAPQAVTGLRAGRVKPGRFSARQWALGCLPPVTQSQHRASGSYQPVVRGGGGGGVGAHAQALLARWRKGYSRSVQRCRE